jgi:hypothetical protein
MIPASIFHNPYTYDKKYEIEYADVFGPCKGQLNSE